MDHISNNKKQKLINKQEKIKVDLEQVYKQKEKINKKTMTSLWTILIIGTFLYLLIIFVAISSFEAGFLLNTIIFISTIVYIIACFISLKVEVDTGFYECKHCKNKFVPSYLQALYSPHIATIRYMKCPRCSKRTWTKKVMS